MAQLRPDSGFHFVYMEEEKDMVPICRVYSVIEYP